MSTQQLFDLFAQIEDSTTPLITFNLGDVELNVWHPDNLSKGDSIEVMKTQLIAQAVAKESTELSKKYKELLDNPDLDRESAGEAGTVYAQILEKSVELDLLTARYIEILVKFEKDTLIPVLEAEICKKYKNPPPLERFINEIAKNANKVIADYNRNKTVDIVDSTEVNEAEIESTDLEAETEKNPLESQQVIAESSKKSLQSSDTITASQGKMPLNSPVGSLTT